MQTEIEIKFFVANDIHEKLLNILNNIEINSNCQQQLGNVYFDTPSLALRQLEMGLRIRRCNEFAEQTIKCRGQVVGGLHARPEYNTPINGEQPILSHFPHDIWPDLAERDHIQHQLIAQFRTDFLRQSWLISFEGAEIELAWDQGEIIGRLGRSRIDELELELKSGDTLALFALAERLANLGGLRLGAQSKAQRGYQLAGLGKPLALLSLPACTITDGMAGISAGLCHWQHHEQLWLEHPQSHETQQHALNALGEGIALIALCATTQELSVPWLAQLSSLDAHLRGHVAAGTEWPTDLHALFLYPAYVTLQLTITAWLHHGH